MVVTQQRCGEETNDDEAKISNHQQNHTKSDKGWWKTREIWTHPVKVTTCATCVRPVIWSACAAAGLLMWLGAQGYLEMTLVKVLYSLLVIPIMWCWRWGDEDAEVDLQHSSLGQQHLRTRFTAYVQNACIDVWVEPPRGSNTPSNC